MRAARNLLIVLCLLPLGLASAMANQGPAPASSPDLDPACIRFDDPNAVLNGEIVYAGFTAYEAGLAHAAAAWSPARGFAIALREAVPAGDTVPDDATLIYRDASIPGSAFKGVAVTWTSAPATITLNRAELPSPETTDPAEQEVIRAVLTHETGHALGLGDVPSPGVNIRECAAMLMKRSVDKGGGRITEPQAGDIALYCMRWGGAICANQPLPTVSSAPDARPVLAPGSSPNRASRPYRYLVVTCDRLPAAEVTPEQVERNEMPTGSSGECVRAPAGVLFHVRFDDGASALRLTDRNGEFSFQKPDGVDVEIDMPQGGAGRFPSLLGFQPVNPVDRISPVDSECEGEGGEVCERVYVLVP